MPNAVLGTGLQMLISLTAGLSWLMFNLKERRTEIEEAQWSNRAAVGLVGIGDSVGNHFPRRDIRTQPWRMHTRTASKERGEGCHRLSPN